MTTTGAWFKIVGQDDPVYVIHGVWPHDKANKIAESVHLSMNPINGVPEIKSVVSSVKAAAAKPAVETEPSSDVPVETAPTVPAPSVVPEAESAPSWPAGLTADVLHTELGIDEQLASAAMAVTTEGGLLSLIETVDVEWQAQMLLDLATGTPVNEARSKMGLDQKVDVGDGTEDEKLIRSLKHPAAQASFHWIDDDEELRRIVEAGDLVAWRLFLHPEQRKYTDGAYKGAFRLSGGAGTGKTVVALHRTWRLAQENPKARVLLTTYTRNLAEDLAQGLRQLDESITLQNSLDSAGVHVKGVDQTVRAVLQAAGSGLDEATAKVLGDSRTVLGTPTSGELWKEAIDNADADLPADLLTSAFMSAEYGLIVLPNRITTSTGYVRVRRTGRGAALDRAKRLEVWKVITEYRMLARANDTTDWQEKAEIAAAWLESNKRTFFDHVVVDEAQDLNLSQLRFLRAVVAEGRDDLFICEDSHQRIYGQKVVLSHVGIQIRGPARRLTLNYRTTAQNLDWAMHILAGGDFTDLEGESEKHPLSLGAFGASSSPAAHRINE